MSLLRVKFVMFDGMLDILILATLFLEKKKYISDMKKRVYRPVVPCASCGFFLKQKTPSLHVHTQAVCIAHVGQARKNWFMW